MTIEERVVMSSDRGPSVSSYSSNVSMEEACGSFLDPNRPVSGAPAQRSSSFRETTSVHKKAPKSPSGTRDQWSVLDPNSEFLILQRAGSFREPVELRKHARKSKSKNLERKDSQRGSVPQSSPNLLSISYEDVREPEGQKDSSIRRVRSFKTTSKGVVNRGDSFRKRGGRLSGTGRTTPPGATPSGSPLPPLPKTIKIPEPEANSSYFKVVVLGAPGVGKSTLTHQFMTSEYIAFDTSTEQSEREYTVSVLLNGEESTMEFLDAENEVDLHEVKADAYMVVFSIAHRDTFDTAVDLLAELLLDIGTDRATILVGNKADLVRKRKVKTEEALDAALQYDAKYTETSAALNHNVDELLVGMLNQIRFKLNPSLPEPVLRVQAKKSVSKMPSFKGPRHFLSRLFGRGSRKSKSEAKQSFS
ncbi:hypothetical protein FSP39_004748 [Pinctada imbricata]|uniref:Uncharacterized protein n=1 Tax=Pinctada imbricata TaxID=66713 RepID=A0AA88XHT9_PINIB|nr:hypothetical protein FSP39_004748 [Pinctada imbricata]